MAQAVVTNLLPRCFRFALESFNVVYVVDKVAMGQVFHRVLPFCHHIVIPQALHTSCIVWG
jgi:hypothetical protein